LRAAYPDDLSEVSAAVMVWAISGAVVGAAIAAVEAGADGQSIERAVTDALEVAARGFRR
jgi:hypothetical protein